MIGIYRVRKKYFQLKKCKNKDGGRVGKEMERIRNGRVLALFSTPTCRLLRRRSAPCGGGGVWFPPSSTQWHLPPRCMAPTKPPSFALALLISLLLTIIKTLSKADVCRSPISNHFSHSDSHPKVPSTSVLLTSA